MKNIFRHPGRYAILAWLVFVMACVAIIGRSQFTNDLSAFLPRSPTPEQQLLLEQIRDGLASRLILVSVSGADVPARAKLSKQLAQALRQNPAFVSVNNGEPVSAERDQAYLFNHRYLLSPAVTPERFGVAGLHAALGESIDLLASPAGMMVKTMLPRDPTGEMVALLGQLTGSRQPAMVDGAWASPDGTRALLLVQTRASGADTDAQHASMTTIRQAFETVAAGNAAFTLDMTGPGVFSVKARETIKTQVSWLSIISMVLIALLLLVVYQSPTALVLGFLPVISGALAGVAAVSVGFGTVHGITLGFGTALIGEAVDYSIYLFVQSEQNARDRQRWVQKFWPTVRLGVLTSVVGFASLLGSGFPGLAQLGLYAIVGLFTAAGVTRYVLPHLLPAHFHIRDVTPVGLGLSRWVQRAGSLRRPALGLLLLALLVLVQHRNDLWSGNIASLSPVSQADVQLDTRLRSDTGAPDVRYLVVTSGTSREEVLQASEKIAAVLQTQVDQGHLAGFESPARYLPSLASQRLRQASLPERAVLEANLAQAVQDLPVKPGLFAGFLADVEAARQQALIQATDLEKTSMAMAVDALLVQRDPHWSALLPLTAPAGKEINAQDIRSALHAAQLPHVVFMDMKAESDRLYAGYLNEAMALSLAGLGVIVVLLLVVLRSVRRVAGVVAPLVAAVLTVTAGLALWGQQLMILHLIGLLLVVAVGSNYALFFDQADADARVSPSTLASMMFANLTTVAGFGLLAFSNVSILQAMGVTVAPGVVLALVYAAVFARRPRV